MNYFTTQTPPVGRALLMINGLALTSTDISYILGKDRAQLEAVRTKATVQSPPLSSLLDSNNRRFAPLLPRYARRTG